MALLQLPPETLSEIFSYVGSPFFHEDIRRLTVSKQWLEFALPVCLKCLTLSQKTLRILFSSNTKSTFSPLKNMLESLDLDLTGYQGQIYTRYLEDYPLESDALKTPALQDDSLNNLYETWLNVLNHDLTKLATIAQQFRRLRILRIRVYHSALPVPTDRCYDDYLSLPTMQGLLSMENLSVLVLDTPVSFLASPKEGEDHCHLCPAVGVLLRSLRILHLRMCTICPDVLKPRDAEGSLHLSEVVVNLSLMENLPGITSAAHSRRCGPPGAGLLQLQADIRKQAEALADRMASPKTVRILTHSLPDFKVHSLDVLTGRAMILEDNVSWNGDGEIVEDSEPESEFPDSTDSSVSDE